ncbi:hypothetical protein T440DRAFT_151990 [Plenodomus tracheiphilus IPT5]|uniref:Uncharacterized protein n=1 Tax=Plenodomus tracheiphilus IPT5 TaxID=1408161 RepID=A0A6A7B208_9PLEO|nr:hypothetical protein T440DRAFT_151990 [Plenodomus tracheiphilus IPT5]
MLCEAAFPFLPTASLHCPLQLHCDTHCCFLLLCVRGAYRPDSQLTASNPPDPPAHTQPHVPPQQHRSTWRGRTATTTHQVRTRSHRIAPFASHRIASLRTPNSLLCSRSGLSREDAGGARGSLLGCGICLLRRCRRSGYVIAGLVV